MTFFPAAACRSRSAKIACGRTMILIIVTGEIVSLADRPQRCPGLALGTIAGCAPPAPGVGGTRA